MPRQAALAAALSMEHIEVSALATHIGALSDWDEARQCHELDEDKLLDSMEPKLGLGGCVVAYHSCEMFPKRWFDLVVVLQCNTDVLFDRLTARGYTDAKKAENIQCEIMQVLLDEARESYDAQIVVPLKSNDRDEMNSNLERAKAWHAHWLKDQVPL